MARSGAACARVERITHGQARMARYQEHAALLVEILRGDDGIRQCAIKILMGGPAFMPVVILMDITPEERHALADRLM